MRIVKINDFRANPTYDCCQCATELSLLTNKIFKFQHQILADKIDVKSFIP